VFLSSLSRYPVRIGANGRMHGCNSCDHFETPFTAGVEEGQGWLYAGVSTVSSRRKSNHPPTWLFEAHASRTRYHPHLLGGYRRRCSHPRDVAERARLEESQPCGSAPVRTGNATVGFQLLTPPSGPTLPRRSGGQLATGPRPRAFIPELPGTGRSGPTPQDKIAVVTCTDDGPGIPAAGRTPSAAPEPV
jgi:hypothetical protein